MTPEIILALSRCFERLAIVAIAGSTIYWGYRLFYIRLASDQQANFEYKGWKIELRSVGPGVFFVIFGAAILSISVKQTYSYGKPAPTAPYSDAENVDRSLSTPTVSYLNSESRDQALNRCQLLSAIIKRLELNRSQDNQDVTSTKRMTDELSKIRDGTVVSIFGQNKVKIYRQSISDYAAEPSRLDQNTRSVVEEISPWFHEKAD